MGLLLVQLKKQFVDKLIRLHGFFLPQLLKLLFWEHRGLRLPAFVSAERLHKLLITFGLFTAALYLVPGLSAHNHGRDQGFGLWVGGLRMGAGRENLGELDLQGDRELRGKGFFQGFEQGAQF